MYYNLTVLYSNVPSLRDCAYRLAERMQVARGGAVRIMSGQVDTLWASVDNHMSDLSSTYPDTWFQLEASDEYEHPHWRKYFRNGNVQVAKPRTIFDEPDIFSLTLVRR